MRAALAGALLLGLAQAARAEPGQALFERAAARTAEIAERVDGVMGVAVRELTPGRAPGRAFSHRGREAFPVASVIKLAVLYALYTEADQGRIDLSERVPITRARMAGDEGLLSQLGDGTTTMALPDLAAAMIILSENSATNILIDRLGLPSINAAVRAAGLTRTQVQRRMLDAAAVRAGRENLSTPEDMVALLSAVHGRRGLSPARAEAYLGLLRTPDKAGGMLQGGVPRGVPLLNKPGGFPGARTECAIVEEPGRPYAICVFLTFLRSELDPAALEAATSVSRIWYEVFHRLATRTVHGRG